MKFLLAFVITFCCLTATAQTYQSPLAAFSSNWNDARYAACNTAAQANYMSSTEKQVIEILNLARQNPALFGSTVVEKYPEFSSNPNLKKSHYFKSLLDMLEDLEPESLLQPDEKCFESASCHATTSGSAGYVGHTRQTSACGANKYFNGECCDYGHGEALGIVMALLIDQDVSSLGHRKIMLDNYGVVGVSVQPHTKYRFNAVLDFSY